MNNTVLEISARDIYKNYPNDCYYTKAPLGLFAACQSLGLAASEAIFAYHLFSLSRTRGKDTVVPYPIRWIIEQSTVGKSSAYRCLAKLKKKNLLSEEEDGKLVTSNLYLFVSKFMKKREKREEITNFDKPQEKKLPSKKTSSNLKSNSKPTQSTGKQIHENTSRLPSPALKKLCEKHGIDLEVFTSIDRARLMRLMYSKEVSQSTKSEINELLQQAMEKECGQQKAKTPDSNNQISEAQKSPQATPPTKPPKEKRVPLRALHKAWNSLKRLESQRRLTNPQRIMEEVLYAVESGWYRTKRADWNAISCIAHAIKMIENGDWRTPFGFEPGHYDKRLSEILS